MATLSVEEGLVEAMAALAGRGRLEREVAREVAERLSGLLDRWRELSPDGLGAEGPAGTFDPSHPFLHQAGRLSRWPPPRPAVTGYGGRTGVSEAPAVPKPPPSDRRDDLTELVWQGAAAVAQAVTCRQASPVDLVEAALRRLEIWQPVLNAFVTVTPEQALQSARALEQAMGGGAATGALAGVPAGIKDVFCTRGVRTTAGSRVLADFVPDRDATAVWRLLGAGAVSLGKTATHEFAFGPTTDSPYLGPTRNPWNLAHVPGGSSGGSAAAVAAGLVGLALGTDTGGSVRIPASACGVVGLKPTYGRISKAGVLPLSWSLDHVGVLARCVQDAALGLQVLAGPEPDDPATLAHPVPSWPELATPVEVGGMRVGVPVEWLEGPVDADVRRSFSRAVEALRDLGVQVQEVRLPPADVMTLVNRIIALAEAASYHAGWLRRCPELYAPDVRLRLELGQFLLARDYVDAHRLRAELCRQVHAGMAGTDAVALPTMPIPAPAIGQRRWTYPDGSQEAVQDAMIRFTAPFSLIGFPALSLPCGWTPSGLPVGLQLVGRPWQEPALLRLAAALEGELDCGRRRPPGMDGQG